MINHLLEILNNEPLLEEAAPEQKQALARKIITMLESDFMKKQMAEIHRIELEKWLEGMRRNYDPGGEFVMQWIQKHARDFNIQFQESDCRICAKVYDCGLAPKSGCDLYQPELFSQSEFLVKKVVKLLEEKAGLSPGQKAQLRDICNYYGFEL